MSNILRRNFIKASLGYTIRLASRRCLYINTTTTPVPTIDKEEEGIKLSDKRIEDIVAEFAQPLSDPHSIEETDPSAVIIHFVELHKPKRHAVLSEKKMQQLRTSLNNSFKLAQLGAYLTAKGYNKNKKKKNDVISFIIKDIWGIRTQEQIKEDELKMKLDTIRESFPASRQELFFIIGDNGNTMRSIEEENNVKITIDVNSNEYMVEGLTAAVAKAKNDIKSNLIIEKQEMEVPKDLTDDLKGEVSDALIDVSKVAGTFITMQQDKFVLASLSTDAIDNAKRLLGLLLLEIRMKNETRLLVQNSLNFTVVPLHDSSSMSLYDRKLNWNRLTSNNRNTDIQQYKHDEKVIGSIQDLKGLLLTDENNNDNISMEARFGHVLFQNPRNSSIMQDVFKNRSIFFNAMPPRQLTLPFIPLIENGGFHTRTVSVDYINKSLLLGNNQDVELQKLNIEFNVNERGDLSVKNMTGIKKQSVIDILGVCGNIDVRLLANYYKDYSENQELISLFNDQCKLISYAELKAPRHIVSENMILEDVTFINEKRFTYDKNGLVSINHMEQQDKRARRTELVMKSIEAETLDISNAPARWISFSNIISKIASNWAYDH